MTEVLQLSAIDAALASIAKTSVVSDPYEIAKAKALIRGYNARYLARFSACTVLAVEREFRFPLLNPETGGRSQSFDEGGKIDAIISENGTVKVVEHKTAGESVEPESDYWTRVSMDTQISKYLLGAQHLGFAAESVIYDAIRKPSIAPKMVPELDEAGCKIVLDPAGVRVFKKDGSPRESADAEKGYVVKAALETPEQYEARFDADIAERPQFYFGQREIARLDSATLEYMGDAWALSQQLLYFRRRDLWPRNPGACDMFGQCEYFNLCAGRATVDGVDYRRRSTRHMELTGSMQAGEGDRQLLTNSRLSTLRNCARKHFLSYEEPTERAVEPSGALRFGTLFHEALEAWFKTLSSIQK